MLRKIPHLLVVTFIFSFVQIAYAGACPFVTPEVPICPESGHIYECGNPPQAEAAFFDFMGQETWVCGQCVDGDLGMGGFDNQSDCCGSGCPIQNTGTVNISTNITSSWTVTCPNNFSGSGVSQSEQGSPVGSYTITYGSVDGYVTPVSETFTLTDQGTITFSGTYVAKPVVNLNFSYQEKIKFFFATLF
jgi:hypothetical protein